MNESELAWIWVWIDWELTNDRKNAMISMGIILIQARATISIKKERRKCDEPIRSNNSIMDLLPPNNLAC